MQNFDTAKLLLEKFGNHILIMGKTGSGKSTLLNNANIPDSKLYDFPELLSGRPYPSDYELTEDNFKEFDFFNDAEKTIILDGVRLPESMEQLNDSNIIRLIKAAETKGKRLIVVTFTIGQFPRETVGYHLMSLFEVIIHLSGGIGQERACKITMASEVVHPHRIHANAINKEIVQE